jgi:hypothetical protein
MAFMKKQITEKTEWLEIDTAQGITFLQADFAPQTALDFVLAAKDGVCDSNEPPATVTCDLLEYTDVFNANDIYSVELIVGYGARMYAPGYSDCTEWSVYDSIEAAEAALDEMFGDE